MKRFHEFLEIAQRQDFSVKLLSVKSSTYIRIIAGIWRGFVVPMKQNQRCRHRCRFAADFAHAIRDEATNYKWLVRSRKVNIWIEPELQHF